MIMEQWWNDHQQGKTKELGEKPAPVPVHHKSHVVCVYMVSHKISAELQMVIH
jgi:hypothetical protein